MKFAPPIVPNIPIAFKITGRERALRHAMTWFVTALVSDKTCRQLDSLDCFLARLSSEHYLICKINYKIII